MTVVAIERPDRADQRGLPRAAGGHFLPFGYAPALTLEVMRGRSSQAPLAQPHSHTAKHTPSATLQPPAYRPHQPVKRQCTRSQRTDLRKILPHD
ncbi:hypothetical protein, partial [Paraburkholderia sp. UCT31]|uniref:hypothetical protein n=1 Tax=Paraburkholderia sp. UCT31 TaxID=2615209 RepID=UPI001CA45E48